jgi:hypothetical protein
LTSSLDRSTLPRRASTKATKQTEIPQLLPAALPSSPRLEQEKNPQAVMEIVKFYQEGNSSDVWAKMGTIEPPTNQPQNLKDTSWSYPVGKVPAHSLSDD